LKIHERVSKVLDLLSSLKDDTNDVINTTPYILRRLSEFTDGELEELVSNLEEIRDEVEQLEEKCGELEELLAETENDPLQRVMSGT
jgi:DNA repair ATPase RecN